MLPSRIATLSCLTAAALLLSTPLLFAEGVDVDNARIPTPDEVCSGTAGTIESRPPRISELRFEGLSKTKPSVVRNAVDVAPGDPYTEKIREDIRRRLRELGLFDRVEVTPPPQSVTAPETVVTIAVRERWTLVPIPYFVTSSGGTSGGIFVIESNLLGYNKQLIAGGAYGSAGFNGVLIYSDPAILGSNYVGSTAISGSRSDETASTLDGDTIDSWDAFNTTGRLRFGYRFGENLTVSTSIAGRRSEFNSLPVGAPAEESAVFHGGQLSYSRRDPRRYFSAGFDATLEAEYELGAGSEREWSVAAAWEQNFPLLRDHRLRYALRAEESEAPLWRLSRLGGTETQRTIDRNTVPAERYLTGGLTYEVPVYRPDWGTATLLGFYEAGVLDGDAGYHGPGGGFRLYVSRVTLPALGFDLAYRATSDLWLFSFSIGMSM